MTLTAFTLPELQNAPLCQPEKTYAILSKPQII